MRMSTMMRSSRRRPAAQMSRIIHHGRPITLPPPSLAAGDEPTDWTLAGGVD